VLFVALFVQLSESRRRWKRLAVSGVANGRPRFSSSSAATASRYAAMVVVGAAIFFFIITFNLGKVFGTKQNKSKRSSSKKDYSSLVMVFGKISLDKVPIHGKKTQLTW